MHRHTLSETDQMASARSSRAPSFSSDRPSVASSVTFQMPSTVRPPPAYIAASVASQTVTDHHNAQLHQDDADAEELQNAVFSEQALALLNAFLDHLLFAFLSSARSPSLAAIRSAVSDVLKPRLAREAIEAADEELQGLLGGDDDEEVHTQNGGTVDKWDVEKIWKRTRLRIMVYTRLGELEDEDEDKYVQQERGLSMDEDEDDDAGLVSWASAIFLTSVIEFVAEQTLLVSGTAAYARMAARMKKMAQQMEDNEELSIERLIIEDPDVEKIALNSALGRLWRTWRKRVRSPISPLSPRGVRPTSSYSSLHYRRASRDTIDESITPLPEHTPTETEIAANIPLPQTDNDVNEIEIPGLAETFEREAESSGTQTPVPRRQRPASVLMLSHTEGARTRSARARPLSMPMRPVPSFSVPPQTQSEDVDPPFQTPLGQMHSEESYVDSEEAEQLLQEEEVVGERREDSPEPDASMIAFAAATGMGFRMSAVDAMKTGVLENKEVETDVPSAGGYESEPKVMRSQRMSIERTGAPAIVRTFSTRSSSLRSGPQTPVMTPKLSQQAEARSYLDGDTSDDETTEEYSAVGIARTSNVPIRSTPTPPIESPHGKGQSPRRGGYVEVPPRSAPTSAPYRNTPTPDAKPIIPERSVARNDANRRSFTGNELDMSPSHYANTTTPPRRHEPTRSASRGASLPAVQEVETISSIPQEKQPSNATAHRSSPTPNGLRRSPPDLDRDGSAHTAQRHAQRASTDDLARPQAKPHERSPSDKSSLKRVASSSSSVKRAASVAVASSGRESGQSHRSRNLTGRMSEEDREREFDSLVRGKETVKVTLTPQNMRALDDASTQQKVEPSQPATASVTVYPRVNAEDSLFGTTDLPSRSTSRSKGPTAAQHKPSPSRKVVSRPLAREPRIESESMRDFADFIRSTGPSPGREKPVQPFVNISGNGPRSTNNSSSSLGRKVPATQTSPRNTDGPSARPRINMEPRSPAGLSTGNDDLIDFIRQGPPNPNTGQPRIPRNVAPFRTTVDSDQFDTMLGGHNTVESAFDSTSSTLNSKHSANTVNSRTGLIPTPSVVQPAYSNAPQQLSRSMASAEPQITRTRRRVKDPYAIDLSDEDEEDEDDDELTALPPSSKPPVAPAPAARQESLMDFLNGMDPPSTSKPQPFMLSEQTIAAARARASAKTSSSSLASSQSATRNGAGAASASSVVNNPAKQRLQARAPAVAEQRPSTSKTATSDLADFLKNSGPPEPVVGRKREEDGNRKEEKRRRFWQRGRTYGDLP